VEAVVLSGGGNYGALQVGALEVLLGAGLRPKMIVGTSAGALNAIRLAADPTPAGLREMAALWRRVTDHDVGSVSLLSGLQRLVLNRPSLFPSHRFARFLLANFPQGVRTFGELTGLNGIRAYTTAVSVEAEEVRVFGDNDVDLLIDGAMASTALPPYFAPWPVGGQRYVDGGVRTNLPLRVAAARGARRMVALWIQQRATPPIGRPGMIPVVTNAFSMMVRSLTRLELEWAEARQLEVRLIRLVPPAGIAFWDFSQPDRLFEAGRLAAEAALAEAPLPPAQGWWERLRFWRQPGAA
jgi:NTE family protein